MKLKISILAIFLIAGLLASMATAGELDGRSRFEVRAGFSGGSSNTTSVIVGTTIETSTGGEGAMGSVMLAHWLKENLAITFTVSGQSIDVETKIDAGSVSTRTATIGSLHTGIRYYIPKPTFRVSWRPYLSASVGPYISSESNTSITSTMSVESKTQTAFGVQLGAGVDITLSRVFMIGIHTGYNLMTDFSDPIGGKKNFSNPEFGIGLSFLFGKSRTGN